MKNKYISLALILTPFSIFANSDINNTYKINGKLESKNYFIDDERKFELETNITLNKEVSKDLETIVSFRGINEKEYDSIEKESGASLKEFYLKHKDFFEDMEIKFGKQIIDSSFTDKENVVGKGISIKKNIDKENEINFGVLKLEDVENKPKMGYLEVKKDLGLYKIDLGILAMDDMKSVKTIYISKDLKDIDTNISGRYTYQGDNYGSFTIGAEKEIEGYKVSAYMNVGGLNSAEDFLDKNTSIGFGVFDKDVTNLDTKKYLISVEKQITDDIKIKLNDLYVESDRHYITMDTTYKINNLLEANNNINFTKKSMLLNLVYDF